jgi:hypothetical protein
VSDYDASWRDNPTIEQQLVLALGWALQFVPPRVVKDPVQGQLYQHARRAHLAGIGAFIPQYEEETP